MRMNIDTYWLKYYMSADRKCMLCGNTGKVLLYNKPKETTFCICPNGISHRTHSQGKVIYRKYSTKTGRIE